MPQVKVHNSESLKKMCVNYVVNNMDYWCNRKSPNEIDILRRDTPEEELSSFELLRKFSTVPSQICSNSIFETSF
jgi:hypothetical protein